MYECVCIYRYIYTYTQTHIHIYIYGLLPSSPQTRHNFYTLNKTIPSAKIRSLTEAASVYLGLLCSTALATTGRDCRGDAWPEVASCPMLVRRTSACTKNGCEQSTASQNLNQRCT